MNSEWIQERLKLIRKKISLTFNYWRSFSCSYCKLRVSLHFSSFTSKYLWIVKGRKLSQMPSKIQFTVLRKFYPSVLFYSLMLYVRLYRYSKTTKQNTTKINKNEQKRTKLKQTNKNNQKKKKTTTKIFCQLILLQTMRDLQNQTKF